MTSRMLHVAGALTVLLIGLAVYLLRLNPVAGMMIDDAWYMVLAKALANGDGFRLISSATTAVQPLYPVGFPALLSLVFRIDPVFPHNVWLLKSVSIAAMMGVGLLTYVYLHRSRKLSQELAFFAAIAVTMTPAFVFLATSTVMSECVFTLCQLATVLVVHQSADAGDARRGRNLAILGAVLAAVAMLFRSAALALVLAGVIWFLKERMWSRATWFAGVALVFVLPWTAYSRMNAPTAAEQTSHGGAVVYDYFDQLSMRWAGAPVFGRITASELPERIGNNLVDIFARGVGAILVPTLFRGAGESGEEVISVSMGQAVETMVISAVISAIAVIGFARVARERLTVAEVLTPITLGIIVLWPFWSFRFIMPLTPFLLFYLVRGLQVLAPRSANLVLVSLMGLNLYDHAGYLVQARSARGAEWIKQSEEVDALLDWINRGGLPDDGVLVTTNPGLVYLKTGRKAIAVDHPEAEWSRLKQRGVRYVAVLYPYELPQGAFKVLYHSAAQLWVVEI